MTGLHLNAIAFSWLRELSIVAHKLLLLRLTGSMWDLSFLTRGRICVPFIARQILKHWITGKVPSTDLLSVNTGWASYRETFRSLSFLICKVG